jgi:hypothetical protein
MTKTQMIEKHLVGFRLKRIPKNLRPEGNQPGCQPTPFEAVMTCDEDVFASK